MGKFNFEGFKLIAQSSEEDLLEYLPKQYEKIYGKDNCVVDDEFFFAKGNIPVLLVSHLDTVHFNLPSFIMYDSVQNCVWSPQGIGADDRAGVYSIISILNDCKEDRPSILFTTQEEVGGKGARTAASKLKDKIDDINFMIEFDRKGINDACFYVTTNKEFISFVEEFGFKDAVGSYSDVKTLSDEWGIAGVNLSVGYENAHTKEEILFADHMMDTIEKAKKMIEASKTSGFFPRFLGTKNKKSNHKSDKYDAFDDYEEEDLTAYFTKQFGKENINDPYFASEGGWTAWD